MVSGKCKNAKSCTTKHCGTFVVSEQKPSGETNTSALIFFKTTGTRISYQNFHSKGWRAGGEITIGITLLPNTWYKLGIRYSNLDPYVQFKGVQGNTLIFDNACYCLSSMLATKQIAMEVSTPQNIFNNVAICFLIFKQKRQLIISTKAF